MDNVRFALLCALGVIGFFLWQAWQADYAEPAPREQVAERGELASAAADDVPSIDAAPGEGSGEDTQAQDDTRPEMGPATDGDTLPGGERIRVVTDKFVAEIDTRGGDLRRLELRGVPVSQDRPDNDLRLLNDRIPNFFIAQNGLIGAEHAAPNHNDDFESARDEYRLAEGEERLEVPLTWTDDAGRRVTKTYVFTRGSYEIGLRHEVTNGSDSDWTVSPYARLWRTPYEHSEDAPFAQSFMGVAWYQAKQDEKGEYRFEKLDFGDVAEQPLKAQQTGGWIAMMQHYFLGALVPAPDTTVSYFARPKNIPGSRLSGYESGYVGGRTRIAAGETAVLESDLFLGPKLRDQLDAAARGLPLTVDYGLLTVIAEPLFWVLDALHSLVGNWGWAIVLLTVLIKLAFYKLSETQFRAMARMRKFAPRIQQLKEQYGDDRQKLQSKMMDLYKKEGFNPLGGCWPLLVQMPVFIALYWVLRESVELRHADFMLWINDLSSPDPFYILPVAFGITMFAQQKLSSSSMTMDPMQQRMMQIMPVALAVFFAFFPAGLVLYWFTNNLLSIAQQWYIYRKLDNEGLSHKSASS
ncbi:hypothetical protein PC39_15434 [Salinisphaera sp. PC39]|uniref:membrane protein insertase YidC n=1 Tax=Salinisphaera sp. PC39 TaxID=1304156 RepID=UPI00333FA49E